MRTVFCGTGRPAAQTLQALIVSRHEILCALTPPPARSGRGRKPTPSPVEETALQAGMEVVRCPDINDEAMVSRLEQAGPDVTVVVDFGQFLGEPARRAAARDTINLHFSLLPALRGAAPVQWAVIRGIERTGVTVFSMDAGMDAGDIYHAASLPIEPNERADALYERLIALGGDVLIETLDLIASGDAAPRPQDASVATFAPKLTKADGRVDFSRPAAEIANLVHGTWPWPGGRAVYRRGPDTHIAVTLAAVCPSGDPPPGDPASGEVTGDLRVATGSGTLEIRELKPAGKRLMSWTDFCNGYRVEPGDRFVSNTGGK